ncbi:uncharacterized protein VTP21DRAFT_8828 [Calcarisporiella thermophila]|uniref:uncharacterized protein n=1 Tax=Calcarisporiella thermophila TaxID=911321 RepID=UPI00374476AC
MSIPRTKLGIINEEISAIGLGCMSMSPVYGASVDDEHSVQTLNHALDLGLNFWDTADIYGIGHNEELISRVLKDRRKEVFLCTKFGIRAGPEGITICGTPDYVREACEKSLERLGVECIDLYYQHRVDKNTPIEVTVGAMAELVKEGKACSQGTSDCCCTSGVLKVYIPQIHFYLTLWTTDIETNGLLKACRELGVTVIAYSPLGRGFLTGSIKNASELDGGDYRRTIPRFQGENLDKNLDIAQKIEKIAERKKCTPAQLCIAWVLAQGKDIIPIPGTRRVIRLEENVGHRSSQCHHSDRPLYEIRKKGRPVSQCSQCRELRKTRHAHVKCLCDKSKEESVEKKPSVLPNGIIDLVGSRSDDSVERQRVESLLNPCNCTRGGKCICCEPISDVYKAAFEALANNSLVAAAVQSHSADAATNSAPNPFLPLLPTSGSLPVNIDQHSHISALGSNAQSLLSQPNFSLNTPTQHRAVYVPADSNPSPISHLPSQHGTLPSITIPQTMDDDDVAQRNTKFAPLPLHEAPLNDVFGDLNQLRNEALMRLIYSGYANASGSGGCCGSAGGGRISACRCGPACVCSGCNSEKVELPSPAGIEGKVSIPSNPSTPKSCCGNNSSPTATTVVSNSSASASKTCDTGKYNTYGNGGRCCASEKEYGDSNCSYENLTSSNNGGCCNSRNQAIAIPASVPQETASLQSQLFQPRRRHQVTMDDNGVLVCACGCRKPQMECGTCVADLCEELLLKQPPS